MNNFYLIFILSIIFLKSIYIYYFEEIWTNEINTNHKKNLILLIKIIFNIFIILYLIIELNINQVNFIIIIFNIFDVMFSLTNFICIYKNLNSKINIDENKKINIISLIPCYNEKISFVKKNIYSLIEQEKNINIKNDILIICDGLIKRNTTTLYDDLCKELNFTKEKNFYKNIEYDSWNGKNKLNILNGIYNNTNIFLCYKDNNRGKKDSLIIGEEFINSLNKYNYIYHTDADTISDKSCIINLLNTLENNEKVIGVSGIIKIFYNWDNKKSYINNCLKYCFSLMQEYQYFYSTIVRRFFFSNLGQTLCLPGCCNLIRINEKSKNAIEYYKNIPNVNNYIDLITCMQGTDKKYTSFLLYQGCQIKLNYNSYVYTEPPKTHQKFINQRRRWTSNTLFNGLKILKYKKINLIIRLITFFQVYKLYLTITKIFIIFYYFYKIFVVLQLDYIYNIFTFPINFYLIIYLMFILPVLYTHIFGFIFIKKYYITFFSFIINILVLWMSLIYQYIIMKMFITTTNFSWNKLIKKNKKIVDIEIVEEIIDKVEVVIIE
jgi:cellulose synthase/poly-beta-1,6-N-acetylglucosamine synthase-like glycosyltransferase